MADGEAVAAVADDVRQPRPAGIYEHYRERPGCEQMGRLGLFTRQGHDLVLRRASRGRRADTAMKHRRWEDRVFARAFALPRLLIDSCWFAAERGRN